MRGTASLLATPSQDWLRIIGRLPDAGRLAVAQTQADTALRQWLSAQTFPTAEEREEVARARTPIVSASAGVETLRMTFQAPLKLLSVVSGLVLLIAVANLANLLIAQATGGKRRFEWRLGRRRSDSCGRRCLKAWRCRSCCSRAPVCSAPASGSCSSSRSGSNPLIVWSCASI